MAIKIHIYLFLMMAYMYAVGNLDTFLIYYIFVIMHEIGHILMALVLKVDVLEMTLLPVGINAKYEYKTSKLKELFISLAGPFASFLFYKVLNNAEYSFFNIIICFTNLIPIMPFDGGKIIKNLSIILLGEKNGKQIARQISKIFLIVLIFSAFIMTYYKNYYFIVLSFYIYCISIEELKKENFYGAIDYLQKD